MSLKIRIADGSGTAYEAQVTKQNALKVHILNPDVGTLSSRELENLSVDKQYRSWFTNALDSPDMNIDGSVNPVEFTETAEDGKVKWIKSWRLILHDTDMEMDTNDFRGFGSAAGSPGLTNGIDFYFEQGGRRTDVFLESVKNIGDFMKYKDDYDNLVNAVSSQDDYLQFDFTFDVPIVLPAGSNDKIVFRVADDLTDVLYMRAIVRGWQQYFLEG